jgi:uncharacterized protein
VTGTEYAVIAGVIFVAACLQASMGFGMGMLAAPVVAMVDPALLPATLILLALLVTILVTVREHQHLDLRGTGWALLGRIPGVSSGHGSWRSCPRRDWRGAAAAAIRLSRTGFGAYTLMASIKPVGTQ